MLLVRGQRPGSLNTPTTPFQQAGIPATINQSGDGPWMSVNMFPSLTPSPNTFLPCSFSVELFLSFTLNCSCFHLHDHLESVSRLIKDLGVIIDLGLGDKNSWAKKQKRVLEGQNKVTHCCTGLPLTVLYAWTAVLARCVWILLEIKGDDGVIVLSHARGGGRVLAGRSGWCVTCRQRASGSQVEMWGGASWLACWTSFLLHWSHLWPCNQVCSCWWCFSQTKLLPNTGAPQPARDINRKLHRAGGGERRGGERNKWWPLQRWIYLPKNPLAVNTCSWVTFTQRRSWRRYPVDRLCAHSSTRSSVSQTDVEMSADCERHVHLISISWKYVAELVQKCSLLQETLL